MEHNGPIRIVIAEDHPVVREGLVALINRRSDMVVVGEACNGRELVEQFLRHRPDIAMVDLRMPEMDGADAIAAIRQQVPSARAIVLTTYDDDEDIQRSLRAGAKAYLLKDTPRKELLASIQAVHEGCTLIPQAIAARLTAFSGASPLSARETEVLGLMTGGKPNREIAALLSITEGAVETHWGAALEKLHARDLA